MRIHKVTLVGFGPFRHQQVVDFSAFDADGLFLIAGETGAGKSSILDGIAYALYGSTPRWEDTSATKIASRVRCDFCDADEPTQVSLEFEAHGVEYKVSRSPAYDRPKRHGGGVTVQPAKVLVEALEDGIWCGLTTKEGPAAQIIKQLVGLNRDEFLQVILLAQGRFQAFLLASSKERLDLLSKLFGASRFRAYQDLIGARRLSLGRRADSAATAWRLLLEAVTEPPGVAPRVTGQETAWLEQIAALADQARNQAAADVETAELAAQSAQRRLDLAIRQKQVRAAAARLVELDQQAPAIARCQAWLAQAERAERVRPLLDAAEASTARWRDAQSAVSAARSAYQSQVDGQPGQPGDEAGSLDNEASRLDGEARQLDGEIAVLNESLDEERQAHQLEQTRADQSVLVGQLDDRCHQLDGQIEALKQERETLSVPASRLSQNGALVDHLATRLQAAQAAASAKAQLDDAQRAQLAADLAYDQARGIATDLLARFLATQAAGLAAELADGVACPVCGSIDHPAPAVSQSAPVTQATLQAAQTKADQLQPGATSAKQTVSALLERYAELSAAAGVDDTEAVTAELNLARNELAAAQAAVARLAQIEAELTGENGLTFSLDAAQSALREALDKAAGLQAELDAMQTRLQARRGAFPTITARHQALMARRNALGSLLEALGAYSAAASRRDETAATLQASAIQMGFASPAEASTALLDETTTAGYREQVRAHQEDVAHAQGVLQQPELMNLPAETIDVDEAQSYREATQTAFKAAVQVAAAAQAAVDTLREQQQRLARLADELADVDAEYETLDRLADTVNGRPPNTKGMPLESYFVAAELEEVLAAANGPLRAVSNGRYTLRHSERGVRQANAIAGLELEVVDEFTGKARDPHTLSGGEQFFTSLALALGLADVVTNRAGGVELQTLFVDEGFATLSPQYLEMAMATLDSLRQGGRTVGIISHVDLLKETIGSQLWVVKNPGGPSTVQHVAAV